MLNLFNNLFGKKDTPITSYQDFWTWFQKNEKQFFNVVKQQGDIEHEFFDQLSPRLNQLKEGFFYLTGMLSNDTAELVFTADAAVKNIVFVEELVNAAPLINGWKFTALKPALDIKDVGIKMGDYTFNSENLQFYANHDPAFPDEIDITMVHRDYTLENAGNITNGTYIFLDNYLGELKFATTVDHLNVCGPADTQQELIPVGKLNDYLIWREKEFVERYEGTRHDTENDQYDLLEATLSNGHALIAVINRNMLNWESKASHPWILDVEIKYDGSQNRGMPDKPTYTLLDELEDRLMDQLKDVEGYLNIGRETADNQRNIYFACKDFRLPAKAAQQLKTAYAGQLGVSYDIYKDKYWQSFKRYMRS